MMPKGIGSLSDYLPPGVTQAMCEAGIIDENTPCASCNHKLIEHEDQNNDEHCMVEDCDCKEWTEGWEPDWDSMPGGADDPVRVRR